MKKLTFILLIVVLIYGNCGSAKEIPDPAKTFKLPDLTIIGKNYLACEINNIVWINTGTHVNKKGSWGSSRILNLEKYFYYNKEDDSTRLEIKGNMFTKKRDDYLNLNFTIKGFPEISQKYYIGKNKSFNIEIYYKASQNGNGLLPYEPFISNSEVSNSAYISFSKIDTTNKIISGEFLAQLFFTPNPYQKFDPIILSNGRFDLKYP
jgi:hypothetical protein